MLKEKISAEKLEDIKSVVAGRMDTRGRCLTSLLYKSR